MCVDEVHVFAEHGVVDHSRIFLAVNLPCGSKAILKTFDVVVAPSLIIGVVGHRLIGWHAEIAQRQIVVQSFKPKSPVISFVAKHGFVELAVAESTHAAKLHLAVVVWMFREKKKTFLIDGETRSGSCERVAASHSLHHIVVETGRAHLV